MSLVEPAYQKSAFPVFCNGYSRPNSISSQFEWTPSQKIEDSGATSPRKEIILYIFLFTEIEKKKRR